MSSRRKFIKSSLLTSLAAPLASIAAPVTNTFESNSNNKKWKHWVWVRPNKADTTEKLQKEYETYYNAGIRGIFFEADSEKHFRAAKAQKLEAHRWMWTMNRGEASLLKAHPDWYAVNRIGESCADKPPYVGYYRWLCPSREEVAQYLEADVKNILSKDYVDGIHLDYVRFCDVILPVNLWAQYNIVQKEELPQYDYCYCNVCKQKFKEEKGQDIDSINYPEESLSWRQYRYDAITKIVNRLAKIANAQKKPITAAVFPTPEVARRIVRQDWTRWNLNAVYPMIYHGFYKEPVAWIGDAVQEGVFNLHNKFPLYAGLYLPDFKSPAEVEEGMRLALQKGAAGISIFGNVTNEVLQALQNASAKTT